MRVNLTPTLALLLMTLIAACSGGYDGQSEDVVETRGERHEDFAVEADEGDGGGGNIGKNAVAEQRVVKGQINIQVEKIEKSAEKIKKQVKSTGGRIVNDSYSGNGKRALEAHLTVRVPTAKLDAFIAWLDKGFDIRYKRIHTQEMARLLSDAKVNLEVLQEGMAKLRKMAADPKATLDQVLKLEKEIRRLSVEIAQAKASKTFYEEELALATIDIELERDYDPIYDRGPEPKVLVGARFAHVVIADSPSAGSGRNGAGFSLMTPKAKYFSFDVDFFGKDEVGDRPVLVTLGGGTYSDYLGGGKRQFLNPWLGVRVGYGFFDSHADFVLALELGCELIKLGYFELSAFGRFASLTYKGGNATGSESGVALMIPF